MIYHYFGGKEDLFQTVIEQAYLDIRTAEQELDLAHLPPGEALETLVRFTWQYCIEHPEFMQLLQVENLLQARHVREMSHIREMHSPLVNVIWVDAWIASSEQT